MAGGSLLGEIFGELDGEKIALLERYAALLAQWNSKINLISRKDVSNVMERHIVPCLSVIRVAAFAAGESVLDIGTGGGLPGIPLAIANDQAHFTLVDSIGKKILAVGDMVEKLALKNVEAIGTRVENLSGKFDGIVARAVTNLADFLKYSRNLLAPKGKIFYLKGGDCTADLKLLKTCKLHSIGEITGVEALADKVLLEIFYP